MISIIIPVYNQATKLAKCLDSIFKQTFTDYEIIVVNDGSSDKVAAVIKDYQEKLATVDVRESMLGSSRADIPTYAGVTGELKLINQNNRGANAARNRGAQEATGDYLLFCDADIVLEPQMLETMMRALNDHPKVSYVYSSFKYGWKTFRLQPFDPEKLKQAPFIHTTSLLRAKDWPGFDESLKRLQDWDLWLTMLEAGHRGWWLDKILFTVASGGTMSAWLPSFAYKFLPWLKQVKKYNQAVAIIKAKHHL